MVRSPAFGGSNPFIRPTTCHSQQCRSGAYLCVAPDVRLSGNGKDVARPDYLCAKPVFVAADVSRIDGRAGTGSGWGDSGGQLIKHAVRLEREILNTRLEKRTTPSIVKLESYIFGDLTFRQL